MKEYIDFFEDYLSSFDFEDKMLLLKKRHTYRVIKFCEDIATSLNLSKEDVLVSKLIGLFHDIGRFKQWETFNTFSDHKSVDHARLSTMILENKKIIDDLENKELIYKAILSHNKLEIDNTYSEREKMFCKIIRDADKLDILNIFLNNEVKSKKCAGKYSKDAILELSDKKLLTRKNYTSACDLSLDKVGFLNDINYDYTKQYITSNIFDKLLNKYIENNPTQKDTLINLFMTIKNNVLSR